MLTHFRNPITTAENALNGAYDFFLWINSKWDIANNPENYFWKELFGTALEDPQTNGERTLDEMDTKINPVNAIWSEAEYQVMIHIMGAIVQYSVQAMTSEQDGEHELAWTYACDATYWSGILRAWQAEKFQPSPLSTNALKAVLSKLANDPKQGEKAFVRECWQAWDKKPDFYKSKAEFARDMLTKCEHLKSQKKIEDWCREWEKAPF